MTWWKADDKLHLHPKVVAAGNEAFGLWVRAANWSGAHNTDGFVPDAVWAMFAPNWRRLTKTLLASNAGRTHGLIEPADGGYLIHDFLTDNPSRTKVLSEKARKAELRNSDVLAAVKKRDGNHCRYCGCEVNWRDRRGAGGGTYDHVEPGLAVGVDNLVVACRSCNATKAGRTPEQAGMVLRPIPNLDRRQVAAGRSGPDAEPIYGPDPDDVLAGRDGSGRSGTGQVGSARDGPGLPGSGESNVRPLRVRDQGETPEAG